MAENKKKRVDMLQELDNIQHQQSSAVPVNESVIESPADDSQMWMDFKSYMVTYTGVKEQGSAVWLPSDVKKRLDKVRGSAKRNIPVRTMVSAIVMSFLDEYEKGIKEM